MNAIDAAVIALLILGGALGALLGLVWQVTGLFSLLFASFAAMSFGPALGALLERLFGLETASVVIGYAAVFIIANLFIRLLAKGLSLLLKALQLQLVDRILGGVIAVCVLLLVSWGGLYALGRLASPTARTMVEGSLAGRLALRAGDRVGTLLNSPERGGFLFEAAESLTEMVRRLEETGGGLSGTEAGGDASREGDPAQ